MLGRVRPGVADPGRLLDGGDPDDAISRLPGVGAVGQDPDYIINQLFFIDYRSLASMDTHPGLKDGPFWRTSGSEGVIEKPSFTALSAKPLDWN